MSWRTQSQYKGLGVSEEKWLRKFDRDWDTKAWGRSQVDAMIFLASNSLTPIASIDSTQNTLDQDLLALTEEIERFTVPRPTKYGWSIHLILKGGGKVRAKFEDKAAAFQAYLTIKEFYLNVIAS